MGTRVDTDDDGYQITPHMRGIDKIYKDGWGLEQLWRHPNGKEDWREIPVRVMLKGPLG